MSQASNLDSSPRTFDGANRFGFQLLLQLVQERPSQRNFVVSPVSLQLALSMAYAGAEGATANAMADTLGWGGASREELLWLQCALQTSLKNPGSDIVLRIANAVWVDEQAKLQPAYSKIGFISRLVRRSALAESRKTATGYESSVRDWTDLYYENSK